MPSGSWIPAPRSRPADVGQSAEWGTFPEELSTPVILPSVLTEHPALGPIVADPAVTDVFVDPSGDYWFDRGDGSERVIGSPRLSARESLALATELVGAGGRHVDMVTPYADVSLGAGVRVHAVLPPVAQGGAVISIRLPRRERFSVADLADLGFFRVIGLTALRAAVTARTNILITGASGSGKTTLLAALLALADPRERIVILEDVAELRVDHPQVTVLQSRQPNLEGAGRVGLETLVREAMRMRPDRLVVGECRGAELRELLTALNTGHNGGAGTLHANSLADVPARLEALGALAGMSERALTRQAISAIGLVVHCGRIDGRRAVLQCGRLLAHGSRLRIEEISATGSRL